MEQEVAREEFFEFASKAVELGRDMLRVGLAQGWMKADKSYVTDRDYEAERTLVKVIRNIWPGMQVLSEETHVTMPETDDFFSIDPLDGTDNFMAGLREWSISAARIRKDVPVTGVVVQPALQRAFAGIQGEGVFQYDYEYMQWVRHVRRPAPRPTIGTDLSPKSPIGYAQKMDDLVREFNTRPTNLPAVAGGIEVMSGSAMCWTSYTAHHWDMAAVSLLIEESGGVAECLDGSPIPWTDDTKLPPVLLAESHEVASKVRAVLLPELALQQMCA